jgi:hypothetical protein
MNVIQGRVAGFLLAEKEDGSIDFGEAGAGMKSWSGAHL